MYKLILPAVITLLISSFLISCSEEANPLFEQQTFTKIYDNNRFSASYFPIDLKQTADGGYLILGRRRLPESNFAGIYLMKVDRSGNFVKDNEVDALYINPIGDLMELNGEYYFVCMEEVSLQAQLVKVDANLDGVLVTPFTGGLPYPSAAAIDGNTIIVSGYNHVDKESIIALINSSGSIVASESFGIGAGDDVEEPIINHFLRTGRQFPFQVGRIPGGLYYFNGFHNYTFSMVFTNMSSDDPIGIVQGQQDDGGFSAIMPISGNKFAAARFNFGDNYFLPNITLAPTSVSSSGELGGNTLPELIANAKVKILRTVINNKNILIYGSDTKSKQIGLHFYDEATGEFHGTHYLGFSNPFEIASMVQTSDGGLAVCGTTYVAGRFPRICMFKLSKEELTNTLQ